MRLTVLGCSGSLPGPARAASGYLVEADGVRLVMDLGNGTLARLQTVMDPFDLTGALFSHLHPDHCADVTALILIRRYHPRPPFDPTEHRLPVYAPGEAPARFAGLHAPNEEERRDTDLSDIFDFHALAPGTFHIGPVEVTVARMAHICEAYGFRITAGGRCLVYTGDTARCDEIDRLAAGADALLAEASWESQGTYPANLHMTGKEAGALARDAGVGTLLVTHVLPWTDRDAVFADASAEFPGAVKLVDDGQAFEI
jgi:ribonuclease BN (tRNA processing enzyme)